MSRMPWRQLTTALRERVAPSVRDRIALHQARYRYTREEVGRVWLTIDGREVIQFDTSSYVRRRALLGAELQAANGEGAGVIRTGHGEYRSADEAARDILRRAGEYDDYCALADLEAYLSLPIEDALRSSSPLLRALAVVDRRVGKRRLRALAPLDREHPLVRELHALRCAAEGIRLAEGAAEP
jgi:hypothetical protein